MNLALRGGNFHNKGDEGMMLTVVSQLSQRLPDCSVWRWMHRGEAECAYACGVNPAFKTGGVVRSLTVLARTLLHRRDVRSMFLRNMREAAFLAHLPRLDAVIDISGFGYSDVWGIGGARAGAIWASHCARFRKPYLCLPQAWGPFKNPRIRRDVATVCQLSSVIYARDEVSRRHLLELPGMSANQVKLVPDIGFLFDGANKEAGAQFLMGLGIALGQAPIVVVTPNMRVYDRTSGTGLENVYLQFMALLARHCMEDWNAQILVLPHEIQIGNGTVRDDRYLCGLLHAALRSHGPCVRVVQPCLAETIRSLYPHVDLVIGSRFHSLVYALSAGTPVMAVGWAHKYRELLRLFNLDDFVMEHDNLDTSGALAMLDRAWASRAASRDSIHAGLPQIRKQVTAMFDDVPALLVPSTVPRADAGRLSVFARKAE